MKIPGIIFALFILLPVSAEAAVPGCVACQEPPAVTVTGTASGESPPDTATVSIAVETTSLIAARAADENATISSALVAEMKKLVGPGGSVKTTAYAITPIYRENKRVKVDGYRVTNRVTVTTKSLDGVGRIIDVAVDKGSNRISSLAFTLEDTSGVCGELLGEASAKARAIADTVAKGFGVSITGVKRISPLCGTEGLNRMGGVMYAERALAAPVAVEPGVVKVYATVNAEFFIGD